MRDGDWPFVNAFNFAYVPRAGRLLFLNACGVCWNAYMSHVVSSSSSASGSAEETTLFGGRARRVVDRCDETRRDGIGAFASRCNM